MNHFVDAAARNNLEVVASTMDSVDDASLFSALWKAVNYNRDVLVRCLLNSPRVRLLAANKGNACLIKATEQGNTVIVAMLLAVPAVAEKANAQDNLALLRARLTLNRELVDLLRAVPAIASDPSTAEIVHGVY
jgi:hypothetical protein